MIKWVFTYLFVLIALFAHSQTDFKRFAGQYKGSEDYFFSELTEKTIKAYINKQAGDNELSEVLESISTISVMKFLPESKQEISGFLLGAQKTFQLEQYVPFKNIQSDHHNQLVYLKEQSNIISNLLVINTNYSLISLVEITGDIQIEKLASLQRYFNIDGLENIEFNSKPTDGKTGKISVYNQSGHKLIESNPSTVVSVNGHEPKVDFQTLLKEINPECIHNISILKSQNEEKHDQIKIELEGKDSELFTVCEGVLYFGQNGYLHSIVIDDECSPKMLLDCTNHPLKEIENIQPEQIKSIQFTTNPRNCKGPLNGEFVVLESK